jgi:hypothetical protein
MSSVCDDKAPQATQLRSGATQDRVVVERHRPPPLAQVSGSR